jgi:hypothetical protein
MVRTIVARIKTGRAKEKATTGALDTRSGESGFDTTVERLRCRWSRCCRRALGRCVDQTLDGRRQLRADTLPVRQAILDDTERFLATRSDRIVESDTFDEAAIAAITGIGCDDVEKRALFCASTS